MEGFVTVRFAQSYSARAAVPDRTIRSTSSEDATGKHRQQSWKTNTISVPVIVFLTKYNFTAAIAYYP
jgi:hypothetical protein